MSVDLGSVSILGADAVGQPGQRRFRLFARSTYHSALMWLEKEELNGLSIALDRSLAFITDGQVLRIEARAGEKPGVQSMPVDFPRHPDYEFQVGQMRLNFNEVDLSFQLDVIPLEIIMERGQQPQVLMREDESVSFTFTQQQALQLSIAINAVVSSGRPSCPLCKTPLDDGPHACVKQNGHREIIQIEEDEEDE